MSRRASSTVRRVAWWSLAVVGLAAGALGAQEPEATAGPQWQLDELDRSFCVAFLIEPARAAKRLPKAFRPVPASRFGPINPALRSLIEGEPLYQAWIPSTLCVYGAASIVANGRRFGSQPDRREMIGMWAIAGTPEDAEADSLWVVGEFLTANDRIKRAAEGSLLRMRVIDEEVGQDSESREDLHWLKIGKTRVTWVGHLSGDSSGVGEPRPALWWLKGNRGTTWHARVSWQPRWRQPMVGGLRVEGKDDLAKALKESPIRMLGPAYWGGRAILAFERL